MKQQQQQQSGMTDHIVERQFQVLSSSPWPLTPGFFSPERKD